MWAARRIPEFCEKTRGRIRAELTPDDDTPRRVRPVDGPTSWHVSRATGSTLAGINRADSVFTMLTNRRALISAPLVWTLLRVAALVFVAVTTLGGQRQTQPPRILIESVAGRDSFELYCSPCHGKTGQGDGPVARALTVKPTDSVSPGSAQWRGVSGTARGSNHFRRRPTSACARHDRHADGGPVFGAFESEVRVRERIANVVAHIQSLQLPSSGPNDPGAQLFKVYSRVVTAWQAEAMALLPSICEGRLPTSRTTPRRMGASFQASASARSSTAQASGPMAIAICPYGATRFGPPAAD